MYGAGAPPGPLHLQDHITGGAGYGGRSTDPVMSLLHNTSAHLSALVEKAGS